MLKATLRGLLGRPLRLLMSVTAVALGVAFVAGSFIFTDTLNRSFDAIFSSTVGDVIVRPVGGLAPDGTPTTKTLPASLVDQLAQVDGAARADGNVTAYGVYVVGSNGKLVGGLGPPAIAVNATGAPAGHGVEGLILLDGRPPEGTDEVALDEHTAEKAGYSIGDTVQLAATTTDEPVLRPTLVGIVGYREGAGLIGANISVFDTKSAQELFLGGQDRFNDIWVTAQDGVSQDELKANVEAAIGSSYEVVTGDEQVEESGGAVQQATGFLQTFLLVFAIIALVVGVFLIINTFMMLVAQRMREMALMRAMGASKGQVSGSVVLEASVMGLIGGALGIGLGVGLAKMITFAFAYIGLDISQQPTIVQLRTVVVALLVGVVTTVAGALIPAWRASRVPPLAAMRDDVALPESSVRRWSVVGGALLTLGVASLLWGLYGADSNVLWFVGVGGIGGILFGVTALSTVMAGPFAGIFGHLYRRTSGVVGGIATENARRNPIRTAITAAALMIGLALVTTVATLGTSAKQSIADTLRENFAGDLVVSNLVGTAFSPKVGDIAEGLDGVDVVSRIRYVLLDSSGQQILPAIDPSNVADVVDVTFVKGTMNDLTEGSVAVRSDYAADHDLTVGDTLTLEVPTGEVDLPITGVYDQSPILGFPYVVSLDTLESLGYPPADNLVYITVKDGYDTATVQKELENATTDLPTVTVKDQRGYVEEQQGAFDIVLNLLYALLGLAIVIAILGIVNTLALSVIERTREVGLLRAVGLDRRQLRRAIRLEAVLISVYGAVLGTSMGLLFGTVLINSLADEGLGTLVIPWGQVVAFLLAAAVVGILAAILPARRAAKLDVLQAIATE